MIQAGIAKGVTTEGVYTPENLIAGEFPRITRVVTLIGGGLLPLGAVLGQITATDEYVLSDASASDGSEVPCAVLAESVNSSQDVVQAIVYLTGEFNGHALTLGAGHTLETVVTAGRTRSLFIRNNQA